MVSLNPQGNTGCGVLPEMWAAKCPGTLIRLFENVFYPRTTMKWDWKYGPKKRQKRSKTPISRESLPYLLYPCLPALLRLPYFQHAAPCP